MTLRIVKLAQPSSKQEIAFVLPNENVRTTITLSSTRQ